MNNFTLILLDYFFLVFHTLFTLFNITGWIWKKTRRWHLYAILATAASWFILGIWYGWGYCACTDTHWHIRDLLGKPIKQHSYISFLIHEITGINPNPKIVDAFVLSTFIFCFGISVWLNFRDYKRKAKNNSR